MADLRTKYMGLELKSPVIAGSSSFTNSIDNIKEYAANGAGAVVIKSIFEEQINFETSKLLESNDDSLKTWQDAFTNMVFDRPYLDDEAYLYISDHAHQKTLQNYLDIIKEAKKVVDIPIIASINCVSQYDWHYFAKRIQDAGADAIELNVYVLPSDFNHTAEVNEAIYTTITEEIKKFITIPFALKIGYYFSGMANSLQKLSNTGVSALVLFNKPYNPDIDLDNRCLIDNKILSNSNDYFQILRWMAILSGKLNCDLSATTGIHTWEAAVKILLAGADSLQVVSAVIQNGPKAIKEINEGISKWMDAHGFETISDFKGKLSMTNINNPADYERVQFMKLYSKIA